MSISRKTTVLLLAGAVSAALLYFQPWKMGGSTDLTVDFAATGDPVAGKTLFEASCAACHGVGAVGTDKGPPLVHKIYRPGIHGDMAFLLAEKTGVRAHHWEFGDMPKLVPELDMAQMADIVAYVRGLQREAGVE